MSLLATKPVQFVVMRNPLLMDDRIYLPRDWEPGLTLSDYIGDLKGNFAIAHNGSCITLEQLPDIIPAPGDAVVLCPVMHGGGDSGKMVMRLVAIVALTVFTYGGGGAAAYGMLGGTAFTSAGAATMGFMAFQAATIIGGQLLINALLPVDVEGPALTDNSSKLGYSYGIDGATNTARADITIPVVYGEFRMGGNIISNEISMIDQTQSLHMLLNAGEGVITGFTDIQINGQPRSNLSKPPVASYYRGNDYQKLHSNLFNNVVAPMAVPNNQELTTSFTSVTTELGRDIDLVDVILNCELTQVDDQGNYILWGDNIEMWGEFIRQNDTVELRPLTTGIARTDRDNGWIFDYADDGNNGLKRWNDIAPHSRTDVVESPRGTQYIVPGIVNLFDETSNTYQIDYTQQNSQWEMTRTDLDNMIVENRYDSNQQYIGEEVFLVDSIGGKVSLGYKKPATTPIAYEYGLLVDTSGRQVGTYHHFHKSCTQRRAINDMGLTGGSKTGSNGYFLLGSADTVNKRFIFRSARFGRRDQFTIKMRRLDEPLDDPRIHETVRWTDINQILLHDIGYNHTALLGLSIKVNEQLSGIPKVTFVNGGRVIRAWDPNTGAWYRSYQYARTTSGERGRYRNDEFTLAELNEASTTDGGIAFPNHLAFDRPAHMVPADNVRRRANESSSAGVLPYDNKGKFGHSNPAWIALDVLTNDRFGAGLALTRIDFFAFSEWAEFCESEKLYFNGVIESGSNIWDVLSKIFRVGHAMPIRSGTRYSVSVEMPKDPVMRFGTDNIVKGTFATNWLPMDDRANVIELTYYDKEKDYKAATIKVYDKAAEQRGQKPIVARETVIGITSYDQAAREAVFQLNMNKLLQVVSFEAPIESLACTLGDVVNVQHEMMQWGLACKLSSSTLTASSTMDLVLDQSFIFASSEAGNWQLLAHKPYDEQPGWDSVAAISGNAVTLTLYDRSTHPDADRVIINGKEHKIQGHFANDVWNDAILLADVSGINIGDPAQVQRANVRITGDVVPSAYDTPTNLVTVSNIRENGSTINMSSWQLQADDGVLIGYPTFESRQFTIRSIGLSGDTMTRMISALEYDERVYNTDDTDFVISDPLPAGETGTPVLALGKFQITEKPYFEQGAEKVQITVTWQGWGDTYRDTAVSVRVNNASGSALGQFVDTVSYIGNKGDMLSFVLQPYDVNGDKGEESRLRYMIVGATDNAYPPLNVMVESIAGGNKISWSLDETLAILLQSVEVWTMPRGTLVDGTAVEDGNPANYTEQQLIDNATRLGVTTDVSYLHVIQTSEEAGTEHWYWVRSITRQSLTSEFVYGGSATPLASSVSFYNAILYQWSDLQPPTPTGGSFATPVPDQPGWTTSPPVEVQAAFLWSTARRFSSDPAQSDSAWSIPAPFIDPNALQPLYDAIEEVKRFEAEREKREWLAALSSQAVEIDGLIQYKGLEGEFQQRVTAVETANSSVETRMTAAESDINGNDSDIANILAEYQIKATVGELTAGIGIVNDGETSTVYVDADRFYVRKPGEPLTQIFYINNGALYVNQALIEDAYIETLAAAQITAEKINALELTAVNITGGTVRAETLIGDVVSKSRIDYADEPNFDYVQFLAALKTNAGAGTANQKMVQKFTITTPSIHNRYLSLDPVSIGCYTAYDAANTTKGTLGRFWVQLVGDVSSVPYDESGIKYGVSVLSGDNNPDGRSQSTRLSSYTIDVPAGFSGEVQLWIQIDAQYPEVHGTAHLKTNDYAYLSLEGGLLNTAFTITIFRVADELVADSTIVFT